MEKTRAMNLNMNKNPYKNPKRRKMSNKRLFRKEVFPMWVNKKEIVWFFEYMTTKLKSTRFDSRSKHNILVFSVMQIRQ